MIDLPDLPPPDSKGLGFKTETVRDFARLAVAQERAKNQLEIDRLNALLAVQPFSVPAIESHELQERAMALINNYHDAPTLISDAKRLRVCESLNAFAYDVARKVRPRDGFVFAPTAITGCERGSWARVIVDWAWLNQRPTPEKLFSAVRATTGQEPPAWMLTAPELASGDEPTAPMIASLIYKAFLQDVGVE